MGRWTDDEKEIGRMFDLVDKMGVHGTAVLKNGERVQGLILPSSIEKDPNDQRKFKMDITIEGRIIDALDVAEIIEGQIN